MKFDEKRYARKMIAELEENRKLAVTHGGDVNYFARLIDKWQELFDSPQIVT